MKHMLKMLWMTSILGFSLNAFAGPNEGIGTVVGGLAGGIIGHNLGHGSARTAATIGGAVIGSVVGNQVGSTADANEQYRQREQFPHWKTYHQPINDHPPQYPHTFIGRDGRLCRHSILADEYGDHIYATYCCYSMSANGYCSRWLRVKGG